jgi:predicted deacylase
MSDPIQLKKLVIEGHHDGPHLLIIAGVHGDEFEGPAAIRRLINVIQAEQLRGRVTFIPIVNEASFWRGQRTAEDELDLARTCPGKPDGSITERVAHVISELIREADYLIDLHSGGLAMRVQPLAGYVMHSDSSVLDVQRQMAKAFNLPIVWGTSSKLDGRTLSIARDANVPAIYGEYEGGGECDPAGVDAYADGCLNVMAALDMIDRAAPPSCVTTLVEDNRPDSGHLQLNYPSPMDGHFESVVKLGDSVREGDTIGCVTDALGNQQQQIISTQNGLLLVLRVFSRVMKDDCLAVILESEDGG